MLGLKQIGLTDSRSKQFFFPGHWLERDELQKTGHSNDEDSLIDGNSLTLVCSRDYRRPGGGGRSPPPPIGVGVLRGWVVKCRPWPLSLISSSNQTRVGTEFLIRFGVASLFAQLSLYSEINGFFVLGLIQSQKVRQDSHNVMDPIRNRTHCYSTPE